jgi:hypothetical protein
VFTDFGDTSWIDVDRDQFSGDVVVHSPSSPPEDRKLTSDVDSFKIVILRRNASNSSAIICAQVETNRRTVDLPVCIFSSGFLCGYNMATVLGGGGARYFTFGFVDPTVLGEGGTQSPDDSTIQGGGGTILPLSLVDFNDVKYVWKLIKWENGEIQVVSLASTADSILGTDFSDGSQIPAQMEILPADAPT